jgi:pimeloyl-ACP methyl ester carboxylesterase
MTARSATEYTEMTRRPPGLWSRIRRIWIITGISATVVFVGWCLIAYRASGDAHAAMSGSSSVAVSEGEHHWLFKPHGGSSVTGLLFFPGALVDPRAYAPLLLNVAEDGHAALLIQVPRRGAAGGAEGAEPLNRAAGAILTVPGIKQWVVAGHSRGAEIAARFVRTSAPSIAGLVLIGSSHPRDFSIANIGLPVVRVYGTRDTVADVEKLERTKENLPSDTRHIRIDGGNHSQFGSYGFQPGDWPATISREEQQRQTLEAVLDMLRAIEQQGS